MMKPKALIGDLFASEMKTLVNTVNCVGVMGKGIAAIFKKKYPRMFEDYKRRCDLKQVQLGQPYHYADLSGVSIVNFPTKDHWRASTRLADVEAGLDHFIEHFKEWRIESVAFPPLGCGNGGLEWETVGPLMFQKLSQLDIPVEIYAPYGTPARQLKPEFLEQDQQTEFLVKGKKHDRLRLEWAAYVEVLYQLEKQPYANPVGRTIFQKIGYILTELGLETGFTYERGSYGPFSEDVKDAITILANKNWITEKQLGKMTAIKVGPAFEEDRVSLVQDLEKFQKNITKTVDLFSRIKDTDHAETVATVIFAVKKLKEERAPESVSEQDLFDYILEWKRVWKKDESRLHKLVEIIRGLEMLNWVKLRYSETLPEAA